VDPAPWPRPRAVGISRLAAAVRTAKSGYQACRYQDVARTLPKLVRQLEHCLERARGEDRRTVQALRAEAYHVAASLLLKSEEHCLAGIAADRSMRAAEASENPVTRVASARIVAHTLMDSGHHRAAIVEIDARPIPSCRGLIHDRARPFVVEPRDTFHEAFLTFDRYATTHIESRQSVVVARRTRIRTFLAKSILALQ
jgi:hypothetical protein